MDALNAGAGFQQQRTIIIGAAADAIDWRCVVT
jgi:hypothetical protein